MTTGSVSDRPSKLLAEWFWTDRWIGSSAFLLPIEPRGLYREMLTQAWRRGGSLPNDPVAIQRAVGCTAAEWRRCWPQIERYWRVAGDVLVNDTQAEVYAATLAAQERSSSRGRKGAQARAQALAQAKREHPLKPQPPDPSPDPIVLSERSPREPRAGTKDEIAERAGAFCRWYEDTHQRLFSVGYMGSNNDYGKACEMVRKFDDVELREGAIFWFGQEDDFAKRGTRTIAKFASRASDCVLQARRVAS